MPINLLFWVVYLLALLFSWWGYYEPTQPNWTRRAGVATVLWLLVGILGWRVFGPAVR
jgi:membrane protein YdbS with pleckstrin-like domain